MVEKFLRRGRQDPRPSTTACIHSTTTCRLLFVLRHARLAYMPCLSAQHHLLLLQREEGVWPCPGSPRGAEQCGDVQHKTAAICRVVLETTRPPCFWYYFWYKKSILRDEEERRAGRVCGASPKQPPGSRSEGGGPQGAGIDISSQGGGHLPLSAETHSAYTYVVPGIIYHQQNRKSHEQQQHSRYDTFFYVVCKLSAVICAAL